MRVIIIDDHPLVRKGLELVASLEEDFEICGFAANGLEAMEVLEKHSPDVALVDLRLPGEHGLDIIEKARSINSTCKYIVLTSYATKEEIKQAMALEVDGYILKETLPEELITSVRMIHKGRKYFDPVIVQHALEEKNEDKLSELTTREMEVLKFLSRGLNNKKIAEDLFISEHTVKKHVGQILTKLELQDRTQAALYGVSQALNR
ncbi:response regulator [Dethiobacter alkaliphilus]|uniref:Two component transcriptional regulator, LuxR family n=1 Tax=Dethiobacter alkaliphilus AHT 1 TaxID=555088 RepID=C0GEE4_DETAL|nr:response regulator transcription factor [Dethiobacter alkaliphilus]EEG78438.1 two component transcriptional regulator, LuxR family [Dethiobacter alkaliphilus AHT 1]